ncbi:hypothetical protein BD413DRAFT_544007 [Trametes elegans]|nr:hypothetical protein BD413DRAFT_544007 [Trametes elegans]
MNMSVSTARVGTTHSENRERLNVILKAVHERARKAKNHNFAKMREMMTQESVKCTKLTPYPEQLDIAEYMLLGLDATCIAGTGWGFIWRRVCPG